MGLFLDEYKLILMFFNRGAASTTEFVIIAHRITGIAAISTEVQHRSLLCYQIIDE